MAGNLPVEGEFIIGTVARVEAQGAYVKLVEYPGQQGFCHVAEVASGWVKNIRNFIRENKTVVCKVLRVRPDRGRIDLSLKQVSGHRKQEKIKAWKNEQKAAKLLEMVAKGSGLDKAEFLKEHVRRLTESFGSLYGSFEAAAADEKALSAEGYEGPWLAKFLEIANANIVPPTVSIEGFLELTCSGPKGLITIKEALQKVEAVMEETNIDLQYAGAPKYRLIITAPNYKLAEAQLEHTSNMLEKSIGGAGGAISFERV